MNNSACELYRYFGLYDEAIAAGERALELDPTFAYGEPMLAALYREMGRFDEAIALYKRSKSLSGRRAIGLAITYARMNRREEALQMLEAAVADRWYRPGDIPALVHVTLGAHDDAIRELERACEQRSSSLHGLQALRPNLCRFGPTNVSCQSSKESDSNRRKCSRLRHGRIYRAFLCNSARIRGWQQKRLTATPTDDSVAAVTVGANTVFVEIPLCHVHAKQQNRNQTEIQYASSNAGTA